VSFPWGTAITAASTLIAGWGGISLKDWRDARRAEQGRRRIAYLDLILRLDDLGRIFSAPRTLDQQALAAATVGKSMGQAVGEIQRAYFGVYLAAPQKVQILAGEAWNAAWSVHDFFDAEDLAQADLNELQRRLAVLRHTSETFAAAARAAEGHDLPGPITPGTGRNPAANGQGLRHVKLTGP
jgi:hypothetical protein